MDGRSCQACGLIEDLSLSRLQAENRSLSRRCLNKHALADAVPPRVQTCSNPVLRTWNTITTAQEWIDSLYCVIDVLAFGRGRRPSRFLSYVTSCHQLQERVAGGHGPPFTPASRMSAKVCLLSPSEFEGFTNSILNRDLKRKAQYRSNACPIHTAEA